MISWETKGGSSSSFVFQIILRDLLRFLLVYMIFLFGFAAGKVLLSIMF